VDALSRVGQQVERLLRETAARELIPRLGNLAANEIRSKGPDELVTEADLAVERALTPELENLIPGYIVVGEEASHSDPALVDRIAERDQVWVIDPLDGTAHFARGREPFGVIVALLRRGRTQAGWIHMPMSDRMASARRGGGAFVDGIRVRLGATPGIHQMRGALLTRFLPEPLRTSVDAGRAGLSTAVAHRCAAHRYIECLTGREHFALYYVTRPWDHAAGVLMIEEAGGEARRFDGGRYRPASQDTGLLVASDASAWHQLHDRLLPSVELCEEVP
jgi:fructose-1,6-bisphosphatase/inositol monophosphatase family enzyme